MLRLYFFSQVTSVVENLGWFSGDKRKDIRYINSLGNYLVIGRSCIIR